LDCHLGAFLDFAADVYLTIVILDIAVTDAKAKPSSLALLSGEERVKDSLEVFFRDT
jgi:phosphatidylglycerophosphate synthase